jgi:predicted aconitase with swiveling domain
MYLIGIDRSMEIRFMEEKKLKGHRISKGRAEGEALVSHRPISFGAGIDPATGIVTDEESDIRGTGISGKILIFPLGKGSSMGSYRLYEMARNNVAPKGIINLRGEPVIVSGAIFSNIPMMDRLDGNPLELIKTGDHVILNANEETVTIITK